MSKAVEKAYKAYPLTEDNRLNHERNAKRLGFQQGYEQAEKDLELTWEDISTIRQIMFDYNRTIRNEMPLPSNENYCKEVLKRFKEIKKID